jgi:hypothetical protein
MLREGGASSIRGVGAKLLASAITGFGDYSIVRRRSQANSENHIYRCCAHDHAIMPQYYLRSKNAFDPRRG